MEACEKVVLTLRLEVDSSHLSKLGEEVPHFAWLHEGRNSAQVDHTRRGGLSLFFLGATTWLRRFHVDVLLTTPYVVGKGRGHR